MSTSWIKTRQGIWKQPDYAALAASGGENVLFWQELCFISAESDEEGKLVHRLGKPWTPLQIAKRFGVSVKKIEKFLSTCLSLELLALENGIYTLIDHKEWHGKDEGTYRERNRERQRKYKASRKPEDEAEKVGNVTSEKQGNVTGNNTDQIRSEEEKEEDQIRQREGNVTVTEALICLTDFSEADFFSVADQQHRRLKQKRLSSSNRKSLRKTAKGDWAEAESWGDKAGGLVLSVDKTLRRIEAGLLDREGNTWYYALQSAPGFFELAEQINIQNRIMIELGEPFMPLEAGP